MRDVAHWSVSCCRDAEIDVRLHAALFLTVAGVLYLSAEKNATAAVTAVAVMVYLLSLAAREAARAIASWRWGGRVECIVLGPLGAMNGGDPHEDPRGDLAMVVAGPAANAGLALVAVLTLMALGQPAGAALFPFTPPTVAFELSAIGCLHWIVWINEVLGLVNCLPIYPLDGARLTEALIRMRTEDRSGHVPAARLGIAASLILLVAALFVGRGFNAAALVLTVLGIIGFFCSRRELLRSLAAAGGEDDPFEEPSPYATEDSRPTVERVGPLRRWWRARQEVKHRLRQQIEREEEARADELLARVHIQGMHSLSPQDRNLLHRVSARYRQRQ